MQICAALSLTCVILAQTSPSAVCPSPPCFSSFFFLHFITDFSCCQLFFCSHIHPPLPSLQHHRGIYFLHQTSWTSSFFSSWIQSFNFTPSLVPLPPPSPFFFLTSDDLWFLFSRAHSKALWEKTKKQGVNGGTMQGMDRNAGKQGKGALWENTLFAIFPKPTIFPGGWENRRGGRRELVGGRGSGTTRVTLLIRELRWDYVLQIRSVNTQVQKKTQTKWMNCDGVWLHMTSIVVYLFHFLQDKVTEGPLIPSARSLHNICLRP